MKTEKQSITSVLDSNDIEKIPPVERKLLKKKYENWIIRSKVMPDKHRKIVCAHI